MDENTFLNNIITDLNRADLTAGSWVGRPCLKVRGKVFATLLRAESKDEAEHRRQLPRGGPTGGSWADKVGDGND